MSKLTDAFRTIRIFNEYNFADDQPYVSYTPNGDSRSMQVSQWSIIKGEERTDDNLSAPWYDYGRKTFVVMGREDKATKLEAAKAYASEKYGIKEWAKTPYGSWMDAEFVKARTKELKQALADAKGVTA